MAITKVPLNTEYLTLYLEGDKGLVFHQIQTCLFQLPALSVALFLSIDEGLTQERSISEMALLSSLDEKEITKTYLQVKTLFTTEKDELTYLDGQYLELQNSIDLFDITPCEGANLYQVANTVFAIKCTDTLLENELASLLKPITCTAVHVNFELSIEQNDDNSFYIFSNDNLVANKLSFEQVMPIVIDRMQVLAVQCSDYYYAFHGAALTTQNGNVLIPGKSGVGKSTFSAEIAQDDSYLFSDEIIVLDKEFNLMAIELPIAIKQGSWQHLQPLYPQLSSAQCWHRRDGRQLKYVWPQNNALPNKACADNILLINPMYCGDKAQGDNLPATTSYLNSISTMAMLTDGGYQLGFELNEEKLDLLITFIEQNTCVQMQYANSEQAKQQLELLWQ